MKKQIIQTDNAPKALGPYSQAVRVGDFLFISGQLGLNPDTGEFARGGVQAQADRALENIRAVLTAAGGTMDDLVKVTVLLKDMADFAAVNEVYARFFGVEPPARAAYAVSTLPLDALIEIESIAVISD